MDQLLDDRKLPIFIHSQIDDMTQLTPNAMRVYMHLARRASKTGAAWPSYQSIGDHCFGCLEKLKPATRRSFARRAIDELIDAGLIRKEARVTEKGDSTSNAYVLLDPVPIDTPYAYKHTPMPIGTKGTPSEGTPIEETTSSHKSSTSDAPTPSLDNDIDFGQNRKNQGDRPSAGIEREEREESEWDKEKDREWDAIPGAMDGREMVQGVLEDTNAFARKYKLLDRAKDTVRRVSFLVYDKTGFEPSGSVQSWTKQCNDLWNAAKQDESLLLAGLDEGELARRKGDLTFSGPRSYISFVESAKSKLNKPAPVILRRKKGTRPNNTQQVSINPNGTVRVKL